MKEGKVNEKEEQRNTEEKGRSTLR